MEVKNSSSSDKIPVFRIKPERKSNKCKIKYIGFLNDSEKISDEIVNLDKPIHPEYQTVGKNAIPIDKIGMYNMIGGLYICNIVGSHIIYSNRYPVMYLNIEYERPMVSGSLFQLFCSIDMNKDEKKNIKELNKYVNLEFNGTWKRHLDCDDEFRTKYEVYIRDMLEEDAINLFYKSEDEKYVNLRNTITFYDDIIKWINTYIETEKIFYDLLMSDQTIEFTSISVMKNEFIELCTSTKFHKFLQLALKARETQRRKEYGLDETTYIVPDSYTKLGDIQKQMIKNDELLFD